MPNGIGSIGHGIPRGKIPTVPKIKREEGRRGQRVRVPEIESPKLTKEDLILSKLDAIEKRLKALEEQGETIKKQMEDMKKRIEELKEVK